MTGTLGKGVAAMKRLRNHSTLWMVVLVVLAIGLTGCGSSQSSGDTTQPAALKRICSDDAGYYNNYTACANAYPNGPTEARETESPKLGKE
jgi:hypothetical protein